MLPPKLNEAAKAKKMIFWSDWPEMTALVLLKKKSIKFFNQVVAPPALHPHKSTTSQNQWTNLPVTFQMLPRIKQGLFYNKPSQNHFPILYSVVCDLAYRRSPIGARVARKTSSFSAPMEFLETISSFFPGLITKVSPPFTL